MKLEWINENYQIEVFIEGDMQYGNIFHDSINSKLLIGKFIAKKNIEDETFVSHIQVDIYLIDNLKYDKENMITIDTSNIKNIAGPNEDLLFKLQKYENRTLPGYSENLPNYIVDFINKKNGNEIAIGLNLFIVKSISFKEYGNLWKTI